MREFFFSLKPVIPYLLGFLVFLVAFCLLLYINYRRNVNDENVGYYGLILKFNNRKILAISCLSIYYLIIIESVFYKYFSSTNLLIFLLLTVLANVFALNLKYLLVSSLYTVFIYYLIYFQKIFISYTMDVEKIWYVELLIILITIFSIFLASYCVIKNIESLLFISKKNKG